jgi:c-di-AMP phosphodiesterase-like protein
LKEFGADNVLADSFLKEEFEEYALKMKIMSSAKTPYFGIVVCKAEDGEIIDRSMLATCAQEILQINGINACFAIGRYEQNSVGISSRSDGTINVQLIMEKLGGGGHYASAATQFENLTIEEVERKLANTLELYLNDARSG